MADEDPQIEIRVLVGYGHELVVTGKLPRAMGAAGQWTERISGTCAFVRWRLRRAQRKVIRILRAIAEVEGQAAPQGQLSPACWAGRHDGCTGKVVTPGGPETAAPALCTCTCHADQARRCGP